MSRCSSLAAHGGLEVGLGLVAPAGQQVGRRAAAQGGQGQAGFTELALDIGHGEVIQAAAADVFRHVEGVESGGERLADDLRDQFVGHRAETLDLGLMGIEFALDEGAQGVADKPLFLAGRARWA